MTSGPKVEPVECQCVREGQKNKAGKSEKDWRMKGSQKGGKENAHR